MKYQAIAQTNLNLSAICFGGGPLGSSISEAESFAFLDAFAYAGGNFIDTAVLYANWVPGIEESISEKTIGKWLKKTSQKMIVATKGAHYDLDTKRNRVTSKDIAEDVDKSLQNLGLDTIDLYYLHRDDDRLPVSEIMDILFVLRKSGKLRHLACSNWTTTRVKEANAYAARKGEAGFVAISNRWSLAHVVRRPQDDPTLVSMTPEEYQYHLETGIAAIPFTSMANGYLSKLAEGKPISPNLSCYELAPENQALCGRTQELAAQKNATVSQIALAYLINQPFPTFPVVSARTIQQLDEVLHAADIILTKEDLSYLDSI